MVVHMAPLGLRTWAGEPHPMPDSHLHADVEINLIAAGEVEYLLGGRRMRLTPWRITAFWAAIPHRITVLRNVQRMWWITIGLRELLAWRLPPALTGALFAGEAVEADASDGELDRLMLERWASDWQRGGIWRAQITDEVAARMRRLALQWSERHPSVDARGDDGHAPILVRVARFVAERYLEPIAVTDIADAAGVHAKYLSTAFKSASGMGIQHYLTRMRLGHAQHLLRISQRSVTAIAMDSGFGSLNAFYTAFRKHVGMAPERWRAGEPTRLGL